MFNYKYWDILVPVRDEKGIYKMSYENKSLNKFQI